MKLTWMGDYRDVVEQLIKYANRYARFYRLEQKLGMDIEISYAQVQVLEYLIENEDLKLNMAKLAYRLGITPSNFTKLVNKLVNKGLLAKFYQEGNKKNVIVQVTEYGHQQYDKYSDYIYDNVFRYMFTAAEAIPREDLPLIAEMLRAMSEREEDSELQPPVKLIPVSKD